MLSVGGWDTGILDVVAKVVQLVAAIGGGGVVALWWSWQNHKLGRYRYLDEAYYNLLCKYLENPGFGDPSRTAEYRNHFKGDDAWKYHYFAMTVHSIMETIFDVSKGRIPEDWIHIFEHHSRLHSAWLGSNRESYENRYLKRVLGASHLGSPR